MLFRPPSHGGKRTWQSIFCQKGQDTLEKFVQREIDEYIAYYDLRQKHCWLPDTHQFKLFNGSLAT